MKSKNNNYLHIGQKLKPLLKIDFPRGDNSYRKYYFSIKSQDTICVEINSSRYDSVGSVVNFKNESLLGMQNKKCPSLHFNLIFVSEL